MVCFFLHWKGKGGEGGKRRGGGKSDRGTKKVLPPLFFISKCDLQNKRSK